MSSMPVCLGYRAGVGLCDTHLCLCQRGTRCVVCCCSFHQARMQVKEQVQELQHQLQQLQQKHDALLQQHACAAPQDTQPTLRSTTAAYGTSCQQLRASVPQGNTSSSNSSMRASASAGEPAAFAVQFSRALQVADADSSEATRRAAAAEQAAAELRQQLSQQDLELGHLHRYAWHLAGMLLLLAQSAPWTTECRLHDVSVRHTCTPAQRCVCFCSVSLHCSCVLFT